MALEEFIPSVNKSNGLEIKFAHSKIPDLSLEKSINLYRILQEIIHNTIKHANASDLRIELKIEKNIIVLLTQDNGKGFDYNRTSKDQKGLGLRNLLSRTEVIGGSMYIESQPNKGTKYTFEIPY
jgi:signal transduction histidine kinase